MKEFKWIHDWIFEKEQNDPNWELPENTATLIKTLETDMEILSEQLGVDLCMMTIQHKK